MMTTTSSKPATLPNPARNSERHQPLRPALVPVIPVVHDPPPPTATRLRRKRWERLYGPDEMRQESGGIEVTR